MTKRALSLPLYNIPVKMMIASTRPQGKPEETQLLPTLNNPVIRKGEYGTDIDVPLSVTYFTTNNAPNPIYQEVYEKLFLKSDKSGLKPMPGNADLALGYMVKAHKMTVEKFDARVQDVGSVKEMLIEEGVYDAYVRTLESTCARLETSIQKGAYTFYGGGYTSIKSSKLDTPTSKPIFPIFYFGEKVDSKVAKNYKDLSLAGFVASTQVNVKLSFNKTGTELVPNITVAGAVNVSTINPASDVLTEIITQLRAQFQDTAALAKAAENTAELDAEAEDLATFLAGDGTVEPAPMGKKKTVAEDEEEVKPVKKKTVIVEEDEDEEEVKPVKKKKTVIVEEDEDEEPAPVKKKPRAPVVETVEDSSDDDLDLDSLED